MSAQPMSHNAAVCGSSDAVPLKVRLTQGRCKRVCQTRRVTLLRPTLENVTDLVRGWVSRSFLLEYSDEEGDAVHIGSEAEWQECLRLWRAGGTSAPGALLLNCVVGCREGAPARPFTVEGHWYRRCGDGTTQPCPDQAQTCRQKEAVQRVFDTMFGPQAFERIREGAIELERLLGFQWVTPKRDESGVDLDVDMDGLASQINVWAHSAFDSGDYVTAAHWFGVLSEVQPGQHVHVYNLACARARLGELPSAVEALNAAVARGYDDVRHMKEDSDLERVRKECPAEWKALVKLMRENAKGRSKEEKALRRADKATKKTLKKAVKAAAAWDGAESDGESSAPSEADEEAAPVEAVTAEAETAVPVGAEVPAAVQEEAPQPQVPAAAQSEEPKCEADPRRKLYAEQIAMLREMGLEDEEVALTFLDTHRGNVRRVAEDLFCQ